MRMDPALWFVQWFFWSCRVLDHFILTAGAREYHSRSEKYKDGTNICHFFRTLFLACFLTVIAVVWYLALFFLACILPFILFPISGIGYLGGLIVVIVVTIGVIVAMVYGAVHLGGMFIEHLAARDSSEPNILTLACLYLKAWKEKYCLVIEFKSEETPHA